MNSKKYKYMNIPIAIGSFLFGVLCVIAFVFPDELSKNIFEIILLIQIITGTGIVTFSFAKPNRFYQFFIGSLLFGWGIMTYVMDHYTSFTIYQWWPLYCILTSLFLLGSGAYKYKGMRVGFVFPSVVICLLGIWYSLFSFKVVPWSFALTSSIIGAFVVLFSGVFFICYFFAQKKHKQLVIQESDEEVFSEDTLPFVDNLEEEDDK